MAKERAPLIGHDDPAALQDDAAKELAAIAANLQQAAQDEENRAEKVSAVLHQVQALDEDTLKKLAKTPTFQRLLELAAEQTAKPRDDDPPGTIYNRGQLNQSKKPWTEHDLRKQVERGDMPLVTVMPPRSRLVGWNGLFRYLPADQEVTVEKCFWDVYVESSRLTRVAREHAEVLFKMRQPHQMSDPGALTPEGMRARGTGSGGHYVPGGGAISGRADESFEESSTSEGEGGEAA